MDTSKAGFKSYLRLLLELFVIFISVVLAFFFDDYRESKNEENQYKSDLSTFRAELIAEIGDINVSLDSFRVHTDELYQGKLYRQLLNHMWLDSLIEKRAATMEDFRFIIEVVDLAPGLSEPGHSPLPEEIRVKYGEHIKDIKTIQWLRIYNDEMRNLSEINQSLYDGGKSLNQLLRKTNPYLKFNKQDSLLFYSNEFIGSYKNMVMNRKQEYFYLKWLVQNRLIKVLNAMNKELHLLSISLPADSCVSSKYLTRFVSEYGRPVNDLDSLLTIKEIVVTERKIYFDKHKNN